jgi:hypothetical protein
MGNQNGIENRKTIGLPKEGNEKSVESQKSISLSKEDNEKIIENQQAISSPKQGKDAYLFKTDKAHLIGAGGFAQVFRAIRIHDQQVFAIKRSMSSVELLDERQHQAVFDEIRLMKENPHPFIVKVIDNFIDNSGHLCMV